MPKICILSARFWPYYPRYGTAHPFTLAKALVDSGFKVRVVTSFPQEIDGTIPERYKGRIISREMLGEMELVRVWALQLSRIGVLRKFLLNLTFMMSSLLALVFMRDSDLIFGVDPDAPFLIFPSFFYTRVTRSKYLLLMTDLYPDVVFDYEIASSPLIRRLLTIISIFSYRISDRILTITHRLKENIQRYQVSADKVDVVELAVNMSAFSPMNLAADDLVFFDIPLIGERFVVLYSGSMSLMYDFDTMLSAAELLRGFEDILFIIRGHGEKKDHVLDVVSEKGLTNVVVRGVVPNLETVVKYINLADVCVIPLTDTPGGDITHPSKLLEFWACGKPVVVLSKGELSRLVSDVDGGIALGVGSSEGLADAIINLYQNRERAREMGSKGFEHVASRFSTQVMQRNLSKVIKRIV